MAFQTGLFNFLQSQPLLTALLGTPGTRGDKSTGVFAMLASNEATMPYIAFQRISGAPIMSLQGANRLQTARFRISCYGSSYPSAVSVAEAIKMIFATTGLGTYSDGSVVQHAAVIMEADDMESIPHGTIYAVHVDVEFLYVDNS